MKNLLLLLFALTTINAFGQKSLSEQARPIVNEGKLLYRSEMASWYGTDLFLAKYSEKENVGGYFSYSENEVSKCIFFSNSARPIVIGTISFDGTFSVDTAQYNLIERDFTKIENDLYIIRKRALEEINSDRSLFKTYKNTNLNLIPIINGEEKKVYVLTGPQEAGVVIFGNDYLLAFDQDNELTLKKQLHKNILTVNYGEQEKKGRTITGGYHNHLPETGDFITATDICTLMLYEKFTKWKTYNVVSKKYMNMWNCETNELVVLTNKALKKIGKHQERKKKKKKRKNSN